MTKLTKKQIKQVKEDIDKMTESEEHFLIIAYKPKETDKYQVINFGYNISIDEILFLFEDFITAMKK